MFPTLPLPFTTYFSNHALKLNRLIETLDKKEKILFYIILKPFAINLSDIIWGRLFDLGTNMYLAEAGEYYHGMIDATDSNPEPGFFELFVVLGEIFRTICKLWIFIIYLNFFHVSDMYLYWSGVSCLERKKTIKSDTLTNTVLSSISIMNITQCDH